MFKLTSEQIQELIHEWEVSEDVINDIEKIVNLSGKIVDEEMYYDVIASTLARAESIKTKAENDKKVPNISYENCVDIEIKYILEERNLLDDEELEESYLGGKYGI